MTNKTTTVADLARANDINPKIARRRLRDAGRRARITNNRYDRLRKGTARHDNVLELIQPVAA